MKQVSILTTLILPLLALAHGNKNLDGGDGAPANGTGKHDGGHARKQGPCERFIHAEMIVKINQNQTEMARIEAQNPRRAQRLQAENQNATNYVQRMESNSTFVKECQQVEAHQQFVYQCARLRHLEQEAANTTNATKAADAKTKLSQLQSNQTLVNACKNDAGNGKNGSGNGTGTSAEAAKAGKNGAGSLQYGGGLLALGVSIFMATIAL